LTRYLVTRPYETSNVGSNLASLAGAVWLAGRLSRTLVVDWRGLSQLRDKSLNYFAEFFETPGEIDGVPVLYAPVPGLEYEPSERAVWLSPEQAAAAGARPSGSEPLSPGPEVLVLQTYHGPDRLHPGPEPERFRLLRRVYRDVRPAEPLGREIERWWAEHLDGSFVVGVNVRTGNGHYFGKGMEYAGKVDLSVFDDQGRFLAKLERACRARLRRLPRPLRGDFRIFYATDSGEMSTVLAALPGAVTRRTVFPPPGTGDMFSFEGTDYSDRAAVEDTLADMFLLARCDAFVYNSSLFNQYARVVTGWFGGNQVHIETLFPHYHARRLAAAARRLGR
jgi:hypothetical protein